MKKRALPTSMKLLIAHYLEQTKIDWYYTLPSLLLPGIASILIYYVPPLIIARLINRFQGDLSGLTFHLLLPYLLLLAASFLVGEVLHRIATQCIILFESRSIERLGLNAMGYLLEKDSSFFNNNFVGSLTKKALAYSKNFEGVLDTVVFNIFPYVIPLLFITVVLWGFSPWIVFSLYFLIALTLAVVAPLIKRRQKMVDAREEASNVMSGHVADVISNMSVVQAFASDKHELALHRANVTDYISKARKSWVYQNLRIDMAISPLYLSMNLLGLAIVLLIGHANHTNVGNVFVTYSYFSTFTLVLWNFNSIYRGLEGNMTDAAQFTELLLSEPAIKDIAQPEKSSIKNGAIEFKNVTFYYDEEDNDHVLFENLNLAINAGEKVGLVGHSGGGKTTITKLLLRFMDIQSGAVLVDSQNITKIKQNDLRRSIAYVPQEPLLFHRSILDNIRYGSRRSSEEAVKKVARLSHTDEFVRQLTKGYQTMVGERGVKLSGGQRQRVAIARAMLKDAPILVLDEATSALDSESEVLIQDALWKLMEGRTAIVIAHRLSTIQKMDRIVVLENGTIVEQGTHQELLKHGGTYAKLWAHQSGGFIEE